MTSSSFRRLLVTTTLGGVSLATGLSPALAQTDSATAATSTLQEVVVTGSRIKQSATDTAAPVEVINPQDLTDRGFVTAGQVLNQLTSMTPALAESPGPGAPAGTGQTFPNLFNLGPGRTLTLVDGHRFVSSATPVTGPGGGAGSGVDTNLIPVGLIDHVDVVQAGGAAVYGSDAIAGVVNYVLKQNFQGVEFDAQGGESTYGDYPQYSLRATAGNNFLDNRANVAIDLEWSKTEPLMSSARPGSALSDYPDGTTEVTNARFYSFNPNGVIFTIPAPVPICNGANCFLRVNGVPQQFSANGKSLTAFNPGVNPFNGSSSLVPPFASGGEGFPLEDLSALFAGVERWSGNLLSHYDINDHMKLSLSLMYGRTQGTDPMGSQGFSQTILNSPASFAGPIMFTKANPFLTPGAIATLSAAQPGFAFGQPLFLSKFFTNIIPSESVITTTDSYRGLVALDGDFDGFGRNFYYSVSYSYGQVDQSQQGWSVNNTKYANAINATTNAAGQIVCGINAVKVVDAACAPINPFGINTVSNAAMQYVSAPVGYDFENQQNDLLGSIGGDLYKLPAGAMKFSLAYEHREESGDYDPATANLLGLTGSGVPTTGTSGSYSTNEYSGELLIPLVGDGFNAPGIKALDLSAQYRFVDNSIAGTEDVWGLGLKWQLVDDFSFRASRSRNFRAPTLYQLVAPSSTQLGGGIDDPCDSRFINAGTNPSVRAANCLALFKANPSYGTGSGGAPVGTSAEARLAAFQDSAVNFSTALVTQAGNPALKNEVSNTTTVGFVFQPSFVPGRLTIVADYINLDLTDGLTSFAPTNFTDACYDAPGANNVACHYFARDATGNIATAISTTYNAAETKYVGETFDATYRFPTAWIAPIDRVGNIEVSLEGTHNASLKQTVQGVVTQYAGTVSTLGSLPEPSWVLRGDLRYIRGPLRLTYEAYYLAPALAEAGANATNYPYPNIASNLRQDISASYDFGKIQIRAGINNFTNEMPSYPTISYGDILGRQFFVGLRAKL